MRILRSGLVKPWLVQLRYCLLVQLASEAVCNPAHAEWHDIHSWRAGSHIECSTYVFQGRQNVLQFLEGKIEQMTNRLKDLAAVAPFHMPPKAHMSFALAYPKASRAKEAALGLIMHSTVQVILLIGCSACGTADRLNKATSCKHSCSEWLQRQMHSVLNCASFGMSDSSTLADMHDRFCIQPDMHG